VSDPQPDAYDEKDLVKTTVNLVPANLDKVFLSADLDETASEVINRAIAFYHEIMHAEPGTVLRWRFADGTTGRLLRLQ